MDRLISPSPSVGGLIKKVLAVNPNLGAQEIIRLVRQATRTRGELAGDYASSEVVDEDQVLALARATVSGANGETAK